MNASAQHASGWASAAQVVLVSRYSS